MTDNGLRPSRRGALGIWVAAMALPLTGAYAADTKPRSGGHFTVATGHGSTADSLDPAHWDNQFTNLLGHALHGRLTEILPDGGVRGEIAEEWDASADGKTWRFKLRPGIRFHDGRPVTGDDLYASIAYHGLQETSSAVQPIADQIASMTAHADGLTLVLKQANRDLPYLLADGHFVILPSTDGKPETLSGIGCGPYRLSGFEPGVRADLTRHDDFWATDRAFFDGATILAVHDVTARQASLLSGEVDAIDRVGLDTVHLLNQRDDIAVMEVTGTQHYTFPMRCDAPPFDNNDVRLALKLSLDRAALLDVVLNGCGGIANDSPITPANRYFNSTMPRNSYDPDKARFHLKKAGLSDLKVSLHAADAAFPGAIGAAQLYREHAKASGIDITVVREPDDGYWTSVWTKKPWTACYWSGRPTEDAMLSAVYAGDAPWNDTAWTNPEFDRILMAARAEADEGTRADMYGTLQDMLRREGGTVIPLYANYVDARRGTIGVPEKLAANWSLDGSRCIERWWRV
ncbi:ABC transporter substrate-binding protein [Rhodospirillaceae bacterium KN72]|uniref:ABC transporter substrate-binding protein n=1 Tax=Pacificispira spongiicola TaxID=2729598 RepID=A0A7Y0DYX4_9PROT|nr:ABC transporter substrate-binding protein [Pacificispira spongiicola]NMM44179.1 ABC transporter substrate-binding protein [Pacificispira spongiicola]